MGRNMNIIIIILKCNQVHGLAKLTLNFRKFSAEGVEHLWDFVRLFLLKFSWGLDEYDESLVKSNIAYNFSSNHFFRWCAQKTVLIEELKLIYQLCE